MRTPRCFFYSRLFLPHGDGSGRYPAHEGHKSRCYHTSCAAPVSASKLRELCKTAATIIVADRQDSYGAGGGNMTLEVKAALCGHTETPVRILSRIYGLGGKDFFVEDACNLFAQAMNPDSRNLTTTESTPDSAPQSSPPILRPLQKRMRARALPLPPMTPLRKNARKGGAVKDITAMPKRLAPVTAPAPAVAFRST